MNVWLLSRVTATRHRWSCFPCSSIKQASMNCLWTSSPTYLGIVVLFPFYGGLCTVSHGPSDNYLFELKAQASPRMNGLLVGSGSFFILHASRSVATFQRPIGTEFDVQRLTLSISSEEDNAAFQIYRPGARAERRDYGVQVFGRRAPGRRGEARTPSHGAAFC